MTLDGNSGTVHAGQLEVLLERPEQEQAIIMGWRVARPVLVA